MAQARNLQCRRPFRRRQLRQRHHTAANQGDVSHVSRLVRTADVLAFHLRPSRESASSGREHGGAMNQIVHIFSKDCRRLWKVIFAVLMFTVLYGYGEVIREGAGTYAVRLSPYT